jgi:hypothetical protein
MTVLRRFDVVLEPNKQAVLAMKRSLNREGIVLALEEIPGWGECHVQGWRSHGGRARPMLKAAYNMEPQP